MNRIAYAIILIAFAWVNAQIADSVSQYQLDAAYVCQFNSGSVCRGEWPNRIVINTGESS